MEENKKWSALTEVAQRMHAMEEEGRDPGLDLRNHTFFVSLSTPAPSTVNDDNETTLSLPGSDKPLNIGLSGNLMDFSITIEQVPKVKCTNGSIDQWNLCNFEVALVTVAIEKAEDDIPQRFTKIGEMLIQYALDHPDQCEGEEEGGED